jgi:hypothetical protein
MKHKQLHRCLMTVSSVKVYSKGGEILSWGGLYKYICYFIVQIKYLNIYFIPIMKPNVFSFKITLLPQITIILIFKIKIRFIRSLIPLFYFYFQIFFCFIFLTFSHIIISKKKKSQY